MSHITGLEPVHHRPSTCECLVITWTGTVLTKKLGREFIIINIDMFSMATWHVSKWRKEFISLVALEASTHETEQWSSWPAVQKLSFVHWSRNIIILTKFSTLAAPEIVKIMKLSPGWPRLRSGRRGIYGVSRKPFAQNCMQVRLYILLVYT